MKRPSITSWKRRIARLLPDGIIGLIKHWNSGGLFDRYARLSFSQEGEDLLIERLFEKQGPGFYVDVGAHHPTRFSNTYRLYRNGWRGINIDATPGSMARFRKKRPRDINLEVAISNRPGPIRLYQFDEPALNSVSAELVRSRIRDTSYELLKHVELEPRTLASVLDESLPAEVSVIDFMTIDVEGHDLEVLKSNDWDRYRPRVLLIEVLEASVASLGRREETLYLEARGYAVHSKLHHSVILVDKEGRPTANEG